MEGGEDKSEEDLAVVRKTIEAAAGKVARITQKLKEKTFFRERQRM